MNCYTCKRIEIIKNKKFPFFVKELETGYVVLGDHQYFKGYTLFIYKNHARSLRDLEKEEQIKYLSELLIVQEAVYKAFDCEGVDIELLSNSDHLTFHIFPREDSDVPNNAPVWSLHRSILFNKYNMLTKENSKELIEKLKKELDKLIT